MGLNIQQHEPITFCIGDSLWFCRFLPEMSPQQGWWLEYILLDQNGAVLVPLFKSIAQDQNENDASHIIQVNPFPPVAAQAKPGLCTLAGWATNGTYRHEIYSGTLTLLPNFATGGAFGSQIPYELQNVLILRATYQTLCRNAIKTSDVQRMQFIREDREKIRTEMCFAEEKYQNYLNQKAVKNGQPDPTLIRPVFNFGF
jgi:hypothetical protein